MLETIYRYKSLKMRNPMRWLFDKLLALFVGFETAILICVLYFQIGFIEANLSVSQILYRGFITSFDNNIPAFDYVNHPKTKLQLKYLFDLDRSIDYSEIGGFVTLADEGYIKFHVFISDHVQIWQEFENCATWEQVLHFLKQKDIKKYITDDCDINMIFMAVQQLKWSDTLDKDKVVDEFRKWLKYNFDCSYFSQDVDFFRFYGNNTEPVIGRFHLHPYESGSSFNDRQSAVHMKSLIFEPHHNSSEEFVVWELNTNGNNKYKSVKF